MNSQAANFVAEIIGEQFGDPQEASTSYALVETFSQWQRTRGSAAALAALEEARTRFQAGWQPLSDYSRQRIEDAVRRAHVGGVDYPDLFAALLEGGTRSLSRAAAQSGSAERLNELIGGIVRPAGHVLDPACGLGGTLCAVNSKETAAMLGVDSDPQAASLAQMRLLLHGIENATIEVANSLLKPPESAWDLVVSHPPLNFRLAPEDVSPGISAALSPGGTVDANAAWLHTVSRLIKPSGQAALVVPPASLSDLQQISLVRNRLVEDGRLEVIIALPAGQVPGSDTASFLWVMAGQKDPRKQGRVLLVDGAATQDWAHVAQIAKEWADDAHFANHPAWLTKLVDGADLVQLGFAPQIHLEHPEAAPTFRPRSQQRLVTDLHLENFKSISGKLSVPLRPLTLIFGQNSAGKSSLIQSLLLLHQSVDAGAFAASGRYADLGSLPGLVHNHEPTRTLGVGISFASSPDIDSSRLVPDPLLTRRFDFQFTQQQAGTPAAATVGLGDSAFTFSRTGAGYTLPLDDFRRAISLLGSKRALFPHRATEVSQAEVNALATLSQEAFPHVLFSANGILVGPIDRIFRDRAEQRISGSSASDWGAKMLLESGAFMTALGDELTRLLDRMVYLGPLRRAPERFSHRNPSHPSHDMPFFLLNHASERAEVSRALQRLGIHYSLDVVNPVPQAQRRVLGDMASIVLTDTRSGIQVTPADVGFGISQVLPIVTELSARTNSLIMIEQPEIHLHPRMQAELADLLIESTDATGRANQVVAETHSETMVMRLQRRVREQAISPSDILILYVGQDEVGSATVKELRLDDSGDFLDHWPGGFFDEQFTEMFEGL